MEINKDKLEQYLKIRKEIIELKKFSGISEIISGLSMFFTLFCARSIFTSISLIIILSFGYLMSLLFFLYGLLKFVKSLKNYVTVDLMLKEICNLDESNNIIQYIVIFKEPNSKGRFLLVYNIEWKCYLFPSYKSDRICRDNIPEEVLLLKAFEETLQQSDSKITLEKLGVLNDWKINVAEKCYVNYEFRFFRAYDVNLPHNKTSFKKGGLKFKLMSLNDLHNNKNIMKKNHTVVKFVEENTDVSKH